MMGQSYTPTPGTGWHTSPQTPHTWSLPDNRRGPKDKLMVTVFPDGMFMLSRTADNMTFMCPDFEDVRRVELDFAVRDGWHIEGVSDVEAIGYTGHVLVLKAAKRV